MPSPWYFEEFRSQSWKDGIRTGSALFQTIKDRGYQGSLVHLQRLLAGWRRAEKPATSNHDSLSFRPVREPDTGHAFSPVTAAALCLKPRGKMSPYQIRKVEPLKEGSSAFATMQALTTRFNIILRGRQADPLQAWIDDTIDADLPPIIRFARTLHTDIEAVRNAIEMPWRDGQTEGQINRLKTLKRATYVRAGAELPRARTLPFHYTN